MTTPLRKSDQVNGVGQISLPLSKPLTALTKYGKCVVEEDFDGKDVTEKGCWILGSYHDTECEVLSEIPREVMLRDDTRNLMFGSAVPEMVREAQVAAAAFILPMYYFRSGSVDPRFAIRVIAFNGIHVVDFFADATLDPDGYADITDWNASPMNEELLSDLIGPTHRTFYKVG